MFYGIATQRLDTSPYAFKHVIEDIETLNQRATRGELDITAISLHAYAYVHDRYDLLTCGASFGDGYGPMVVAREPLDLKELPSKTIAIPGKLTTANLTLRLLIGNFDAKVMPFDRILEAAKEGEADAGLIIHEGQLTYRDYGLEKIVDLGEWWLETTDGLPLPLGLNAIKKTLNGGASKEINKILRRSIQFSLDHREEAVEYSLKYARGLDSSTADRFVGMYVNDLTLDYGERGRKAIERLLSQGCEKGIIPKAVQPQFVES